MRPRLRIGRRRPALSRLAASLLACQVLGLCGCADDDENRREAPSIDSVCASECSAIEACYDWHWAEFDQDMDACLSYCVGFYEEQRDTEFSGASDCFDLYMIYRKCVWDETLGTQCDEAASEQACEPEWSAYVDCVESS